MERRTGTVASPQKVMHVGKFDYQAEYDDQLSFAKGDIMSIESKDGDWWYAHLMDSDQEGFIPSNYVAEHNSLEAEE